MTRGGIIALAFEAALVVAAFASGFAAAAVIPAAFFALIMAHELRRHRRRP